MAILAQESPTRWHRNLAQLLIGGRDAQRAMALAKALGHGVQGVGIDLSKPGFSQTLREMRIELLVHTAGPFQAQGYAVARAAAAAGAHYIDLADGRRVICAQAGNTSTATTSASHRPNPRRAARRPSRAF